MTSAMIKAGRSATHDAEYRSKQRTPSRTHQSGPGVVLADAAHPDPARMIVTLTVEELDERIERAVSRALAASVTAAVSQQTKRTRLTVRETAEQLRCSERKVHRLITAGLLHATKTGVGGSSRQLIASGDVERLREEGV